MKTGSIFIKLTFPQPWPVVHDRILMESEQQGSLLSIKAYSSGSISFTVSNKTSQVVQYTSPRITMSTNEQTTAVVAFVWEENQPTKLYINGTPIDHKPLNLHSLAPTIKEALPSTEHPDRIVKCAPYVKLRYSAFASRINGGNSSSRRPMSPEEQLEQLVRSIDALRGLFVEVSNGREHFLGHIATDLRALLYYKGQNFISNNYNPLLLRLAGIRKIELPVYFVPSVPDEKLGLLDEASHFIEDPLVSIIRFNEKQELGDLCDCLAQRVIRMRLSEERSQEIKTLSLNEVICAVSTTIGSAHYDESIPLEVDFIRHLFVVSKEGALLKKIVLDLARSTIECAKYLLEKVK